jgi:hypothetical protein
MGSLAGGLPPVAAPNRSYTVAVRTDISRRERLSSFPEYALRAVTFPAGKGGGRTLEALKEAEDSKLHQFTDAALNGISTRRGRELRDQGAAQLQLIQR